MWRCAQCVGGKVTIPGAGAVDFTPSDHLREMRGNCGGPFSRALATQYGAAEIETETVATHDGAEIELERVVVTGKAVLANWPGALKGVRFSYCPMVHLDPMSPAYEPLAWLDEAIEGAQALGADMRLGDALPDVSQQGRRLVMRLIQEARARAEKERS